MGRKKFLEEHVTRSVEGCGNQEQASMIDLRYSLTIEATGDPSFFSFYSPDLEGFSGVGSSIEDCVYRAKWGMIEHTDLLAEQGLPVPAVNPAPQILIHNAEHLSPA